MPDDKNIELDVLEAAMAADLAENAPLEELEADLARRGIDPARLAARARELTATGGESESRAAWRERARAKLAAARDRVKSTARAYADMTRAELLGRLDAIRNHPRLSAPVTAAFRKRSPEESSDDELRAILADVDALVAVVEGEQNGGEGEGEGERER